MIPKWLSLGHLNYSYLDEKRASLLQCLNQLCGGAFGLDTELQTRMLQVISTMSLEFFIDVILPTALWFRGRLRLLTEINGLPGIIPRR